MDADSSQRDTTRRFAALYPASQNRVSELAKAVFLDKDGTLLEDVPYNVEPAKMQLCAGVISGLQLLHAAGYKLVVISNQSGVARGYFPETALVTVEQHLRSLLADHDIPLAGFYYCPHYLEGTVSQYAIDCQCRKPKPGLLYKAAQDQAIDLKQSWFVGDILHDVEAGRAAGCRTVLINNGNETEWHLSDQCLPHHIVTDLTQAAKVMLAIDSSHITPISFASGKPDQYDSLSHPCIHSNSLHLLPINSP